MLSFIVEERKNIAIIHIKGELFQEKLSELEKVWAEQIEKEVATIAIDCAELTFIDSPTIGALVKFFNEAMVRGKKLIFYELNPPIKALFNSARLERFFPIFTKEKFEKEFLEVQ
ncbi:MAG: STAS domain-containing protein [Spirochaetes bacterium]|nr:STAS domain-containing protein [Spirochaetota bacterium]